MVGVPAIADVAALLGFLAHLGDHRIAGHGGKETVDVDAAEAPGKGEMLLRRQLLVPEEDNAVLAERLTNLGHHRPCRPNHQIDP